MRTRTIATPRGTRSAGSGEGHRDLARRAGQAAREDYRDVTPLDAGTARASHLEAERRAA
jgi:hypothetical protein